MNVRLRIFLLTISVALILGIISLVREKKLKERYSLFWLFIGFIFLALAVLPDIVISVSNALGIYEPSNLLFLIASFFFIILGVHYAVRISALSDQTRRLAQELALLKEKMG